MAKEHILVVEDESDIQELIRYNLVREGYKVTVSGSGEAGLQTARKDLPDMLVLDLMLPSMNGLDVCRTIKSDPMLSKTPILIVSARGEEADVVTGLELGADDYLTKPFSPRVLIARVRAVLRRRDTHTRKSNDQEPVTIHDLNINPGRHEVFLDGEPLSLTATEFRILHVLSKNPGWVFTRHQIVESVHGDDYPVTDRSIDVQIAGLRKKLGSFAEYIETVRGIGYRMKE